MPGFGNVLLVLLVTGVIFVNGFTDAPNAITGVVVTGALRYRTAVRLAAVCNLAGIALMGALNSSVANTMASLADFSGATYGDAIAGLCAVMLSIILFAVAAWYFGIPTSESHALAAALAGASVALGGASSVVADARMLAGWTRMAGGLVISLFMGFALGWFFMRILGSTLKRLSEQKLGRLQIAGAGAMAFMHGAQDGQKFIAVFIMAELLAAGRNTPEALSLSGHLPAVLLCALVMALGTGMGGRRIIETVGERMVAMDGVQTVCSDLGGAICLLAASLGGIPMSTTHTKTSAIMGAGRAARGKTSHGVFAGMLAAWAVTFPVCALLGYLFSKILVRL